MQRDDIITAYGLGSLPRIVDTINCFRRRYGAWPTTLLVDADMLQALQEYNLTPAGMRLLAAKLTIGAAKGTIIARDDQGQTFEYDASHMKPERPGESADYWLWGCRVYPE